MKDKKIYVLIGPPSVGKSTWIKETFKNVNPYIINRDDLAEKVAEEYGWTYDDMFVSPPLDSNEGDKSDKYGEVVKAPSYMNWPGAPKVVYDKVVEANGKVQNLFTERVKGAIGKDTIVVDMTNMNVGSRKGALKSIEGKEYEYHKVAVVFNFKGAEDIIKKVAQKRAEDAKKMGKSKTIPEAAFDRMFQSYDLTDSGKELSEQEVESRLKQEGFDEVIMKDNTEELRKVISEVSESQKSIRYIKNFKSYRRFK